MSRERDNTAESTHPPRRHIWLVCIALSVATLAIYAQVLQFQFVDWDDRAYVFENPHIAQGLTPQSMAWAFTSNYAANWHPLTWISHMLDVQLFGLERGPDAGFLQGPGGHHMVSVLLHVGNSLLLLLLLYRMTGAFWPSALTAALFAFHPLRVESVAWVSERKDVLSGFFFMLTLLSYHWYAKRPALKRYLLVFICLALGLMSKPMLITVPFLLLLLDLWPLRRMQFEQPSTLRYAAPGKETKVTMVDASAYSADPAEKPKHQPSFFVLFVTFCSKLFATERTELTGSESNPGPGLRFLILEKLPLFALAIASCFVTLSVQTAGGAVSSLERLPWAWRLVNAPVATVMYLFKTLWPTNLAYAYPHAAHIPTQQLGDWILLAGAATLLLVLISVILFRTRSQPYLLVGWLWLLGMLLPVIGLIQVGQQAWADRYAYLPLVGIYVIISWSLARCVHRRPAARRAVIAGAIVSLFVFLPLTWRQVAVWRDTEHLFRHAQAVSRNNFLAHNNWGGFLLENDQFEDALTPLQEALRINPKFAVAHNNMGMALKGLGHPAQALEHYDMAVQRDPNYIEAHLNWGNALETLGRFDEAIAHYQKALQIRPLHAEAQLSWGNALAKSGEVEQAIAHYRQALQIKPDYAEAHNNMGHALATRGQIEEAIAHYQQALRIDPDYATAHLNWGNALVKSGQIEEAIARYQQALQIDPELAEAHNNMGMILERSTQLADALKHFEHALRVKPDYTAAREGLRRVRERMEAE